MRDEIRIAPADGQAAEDVADVLAQAAEAQGLDFGIENLRELLQIHQENGTQHQAALAPNSPRRP